MENKPTKVCPECNHLYNPGEEHKCPTDQYILARDKLVEAAAQWDEDNFWDSNGNHIEQ